MATLLITCPMDGGSINLGGLDCYGTCLVAQDGDTGLYLITGTQDQVDAVSGADGVVVASSDKEEMRQPEFSCQAAVTAALSVKQGGGIKIGGGVGVGIIQPLPKPDPVVPAPGPFDGIDLSGFGVADPEDVPET